MKVKEGTGPPVEDAGLLLTQPGDLAQRRDEGLQPRERLGAGVLHVDDDALLIRSWILPGVAVTIRDGRPDDVEAAVAVWQVANTARRGGVPVPAEHEHRVRGYL